jgi:flagellar basal-body rod modification protein FlgD
MNIQGFPAVGTALAPAATSSMASAKPAASGTAQSTTQTANSAEQTFINLLVTELQSQDPTSPMDPTTMVGQMFQMNQLQQLIDINQTLSTALGGASPSNASSSAMAGPLNPGTSLLQAAASALPATAAASYARQLLTGVN